MANVVKKENLTISIREYQDNNGQAKKVWKTIGELITWDDGHQSFEMWGPHGLTKGSVFSQDNQNQQPQQQYQGQPQGGYQQQPQYNNQAPQQQYQNPPQGGYQQR